MRPDLDGVGHRSRFGDELVVHGLLDEEAAGCAAALAVVEEEPDVGGGDGCVNVCVFKNDEGGLAAEFEGDLVWCEMTDEIWRENEERGITFLRLDCAAYS